MITVRQVDDVSENVSKDCVRGLGEEYWTLQDDKQSSDFVFGE